MAELMICVYDFTLLRMWDQIEHIFKFKFTKYLDHEAYIIRIE